MLMEDIGILPKIALKLEINILYVNASPNKAFYGRFIQ